MEDKETEPGDQTYEEREAVAIFQDEKSLNAAIDQLMQIGIRREDLSLLTDAKSVPGKGATAEQEADEDFVQRQDVASPDSRTEGIAALVSVPVYVAGAGIAAVAGGAALIPTIAIVAGGGLAAGTVGLILARVFGRYHAERVRDQIARGGLLLWVHLPDKARDDQVLGILRESGASDVHIHTARRSWGVSDVPMHDTQPDPFL